MWPFKKQERVEIRSYTDSLTASFISQALSGSEVGQIAGLEVAAGLYSRAFMSASVEPMNRYTEGLTADVLALMARNLIRRGESLHLIEVEDGQVTFSPVGSHNVFGGYKESAWHYRVTFDGPSQTETKWVQGASVIHVRYGTHPERNWEGTAPLHFSGVSAKLAGNLEARLSEEAGQPVGALLPVPGSTTGKADARLAGLQKDLDSLRGGNILIESVQGNWAEGRGNSPRGDWEARRLGMNAPASTVVLHDQSYRQVLAALGVPVELGIASGSGQGAREAYRRFIFSSVMPLARLVESELRNKLGVEVRLGFKDLQAADLSGRAVAFKKLVEGGVPSGEAFILASLEELSHAE